MAGRLLSRAECVICGGCPAWPITFAVARPRGLFATMLHRTGLAARIGADRIFPSVRSGVQAYRDAASLTGG